MRRHVVIVIIAVCALATPLTRRTAAAPQSADDLTRALVNRFGLSQGDRNILDAGHEVVRALPPSSPDGVTALGSIWIDARPDTYLRWAEGFAAFDRGSSVQT